MLELFQRQPAGLPNADTPALNAHLTEISRAIAKGGHAIFALDGAGRHGSKALRIPEIITLPPLPPQAPELIPIENVRTWLRANCLVISVFETCDEIVTQCCDAWNFLVTISPRCSPPRPATTPKR